MTTAALLDTSVFIAAESGRALDEAGLPETAFVSVITIAELQLGVLAATDTSTRARRLATLQGIAHLEPLPIDLEAAARWAELRMLLAQAGRKVNVNDLWIAAVAAANRLPIVTQDGDFDVIAGLGGPHVVVV